MPVVKNRIEDIMYELFRALEEHEHRYGISITIGKYLEIKQHFLEVARRAGLP